MTTMRKPATRARRTRGFTLLEVLVASALLLFGLSGVALLSLSSANSAAQAVEADTAAKLASLLVEEQVTVGLANLPAAGTVINGTWTFASGKTATTEVDIIDTSGAITAGTPNLGFASRLVRATVSWTSPLGIARSLVNESYVSQNTQ